MKLVIPQDDYDIAVVEKFSGLYHINKVEHHE